MSSEQRAACCKPRPEGQRPRSSTSEIELSEDTRVAYDRGSLLMTLALRFCGMTLKRPHCEALHADLDAVILVS